MILSRFLQDSFNKFSRFFQDSSTFWSVNFQDSFKQISRDSPEILRDSSEILSRCQHIFKILCKICSRFLDGDQPLPLPPSPATFHPAMLHPAMLDRMGLTWDLDGIGMGFWMGSTVLRRQSDGMKRWIEASGTSEASGAVAAGQVPSATVRAPCCCCCCSSPSSSSSSSSSCGQRPRPS